MFKFPELHRLTSGPRASKVGENGAFMIDELRIIASVGEGWEHVSVSLGGRCPKWSEMCIVKAMFWDDEDCVVQFHPPKSEHVNCHPYCLHLWRPIGRDIETPPSILVGPK